MTPKIAASYVRSSRERDDAFSLASQLTGNRAYAQDHHLLLPEEYEYAEEFTGTVIHRPALNKIRQLIQQRAIDALIVYVTDRLSRKSEVGEFLLNELFEHGVELHIVAWGGAVHDTPNDRARFSFELRSSDYERQKLLERTQRGSLQKLTGSDGIPPAWLGQGPIDKYGYQKLGKKRATRLVIVPEEATVVALIFTLFVVQRKGAREIARHLNEGGVPTRSQAKGFKRVQSSSWSRTDIYKILQDESYIGVFYANKNVTHRNSKGKKSAVLRPREEWIRLDFPELAIVDAALYAAAQKRLAEGRRKNAHVPTNQYLMSRRIRCECGYATGVRTESRRPSKLTYYFCGRKGRGKDIEQSCSIPTIRGDVLDRKVWKRLEVLVRNAHDLLRLLHHIQVVGEQQQSEALGYLRQAQTIKAGYERELKIFYSDYHEGLITRSLYLEKKAELDTQLAAAEEILREYDEQLAKKLLASADVSGITDELAHLRAEFEQNGDLTFEQRRRVIEALHITAQVRQENGWLVLYLYVYNTYLDTLLLQTIKPGGKAAGEES